jgi:hypothetical protein
VKYLPPASSERPLSRFDAFPFQARQSVRFIFRAVMVTNRGLAGARRSLCAITGSLSIGRRKEDGCSRPMLAV